MKPPELIQIAQGLDQDKPILCQVVANKGGAWNVDFKFTPAGKMPSGGFVSFNLLTIRHEEIEYLNPSEVKILLETCQVGHKFAKLEDHPTIDGKARCPHCMAAQL